MTRTFTRSGIDPLGLSQWNATTTFHTTAEVEPMAAPDSGGRRRALWPIAAGLVVAGALGALAIAQGGESPATAAPDAAAVVAAPDTDASLTIDELDAAPADEIEVAAIDAAPPPAVEPIKLRVTSAPPGAAVSLDGKRLGTTPLTARLEPRPGRGRLKIARAGFEPVELRVARDRDGAVHRELGALIGTVNIGVSRSWARVYRGGTYLGDTPLRGVKLPHGTHRIRLENPETGKKRSVTVTVPRSKPYVFDF
jgi:hypothetical protein